jgi:hypothetical protein
MRPLPDRAPHRESRSADCDDSSALGEVRGLHGGARDANVFPGAFLCSLPIVGETGTTGGTVRGNGANDREPPQPIAQLLAVMREAGLTQREAAEWVLGRDERTVQRYLSGARIPFSQRQWLRRLESVEVSGELVHITVRRGPISRRWISGKVA